MSFIDNVPDNFLGGSWLKHFTLCTWKERVWFTDSKNTKISIFIKMDLGLFKILGFFGGGGVRGLKMGE